MALEAPETADLRKPRIVVHAYLEVRIPDGGLRLAEHVSEAKTLV